MENQNLKNNNLDTILLIKYAIENIHNITNVADIVSRFQNSIEDITNEAHERVDTTTALLLFNKYLGQKNYFFKFRENDNLWGEISLDFLPFNATDLFKKEVQKNGDNSIQNRLANFRIQLFSNLELIEKYNITLEAITNLCGLPNKSDIEIENSKVLKETYGQDILCWHFNKDDTNYFVSFYCNNTNNPIPYISFSVSEMI